MWKCEPPRQVPILVALVLALAAAGAAAPAASRQDVTTPVEQFGFELGADYHLANYQQLVEYWQVLERQSGRLALEVIGETERGRPIQMAIITSPENHADLDRYREISRRLALAEGVDDDEARRLAGEGKAVVWIDGGLHATETLGAQQLMELVYRMVSRDDPETRRILDEVILLAVCVNPDGLDLVADWYMREPVPERRSLWGLPVLYQHYAGHDNNRDFYMSTQKETIAINRVLYREWFPQIVYNHHQTGPAGTVLFAPPFRDPFNYNIDPLTILGIERVGNAMHTRFVREGKPGATTRSGASYSTWWNGGLRTTPYWHNSIGLLTETIGSPSPGEIPFILGRQLPDSDLVDPIAPQEWRFRQSVEYSMTANYAVLDIAAKLKEDFLYNIWRMGRNSIERGQRDTWTRDPSRIAAVEAAVAATHGRERRRSDSATFTGDRTRRLDSRYWEDVWRDPGARDPRGYVLPVDQPDFPTATKFVNVLIKNGVQVHRANRDFEARGTEYGAGSYVVFSAQAYRPFVLDMFEPQHHPDDFAYPGAPPTPPYDISGWTVAYQMGIAFDRILEGFDGPFEPVPDLLPPPPAPVADAESAAGFLVDPRLNDSFRAVNRLLAAGEDVDRFSGPVTAGGISLPPGAFWVASGDGTVGRLREIATELGVAFHGVRRRPSVPSAPLSPVRIGLWDRYGGSIASGWTRWVLEQFEFPFELVFPQRLDAGALRDDFDVLLFVSGAIPPPDRDDARRFGRGPARSEIPAEYHDRLGSATVGATIPRLREFVEGGGTIVALGESAMNLTIHLELPLDDHLLERDPDGAEAPLGREQFYVPGSILRMRVDNEHPLAWGMGHTADIFFRSSPVFHLEPEAYTRGAQPVGWFGTEPLRSGWAWGQSLLEHGVAAVAARVGNGHVYLLGPDVNFRGQSHGTFKLLFNGIYGGQDEVTSSQ